MRCWSQAQVRLSALAVLVVLLTIGCQAPWAKVQEDVTSYVSDVREPLARLSSWVSDLNAFYTEARAGDLQQVACASGRLAALVGEGRAATAALEAVEPPSAVKPVHEGVVEGARSLVDKLSSLHKLLCEQGNLTAAQEVFDQVGGALGTAPDWLGKLSSWLAER